MQLMDKQVLVISRSYPTIDDNTTQMYIHIRNVKYVSDGLRVTVLNFSSKEDYFIDRVRVISEETYKDNPEKYDVLLIHAANIRNHYYFLKKYGSNFRNFLFFYHGHEVMRINKDYSAPYFYMRPFFLKNVLQNIYDELKLAIWKKYLPEIINKSYFIFVSKWMHDIFMKNVGLSYELIKNRFSIIYNSIGDKFETSVYDSSLPKEYDFITIRANLDNSKYAVDIVNRLAQNSRSCKFLLIGKGELFEHIKMSENIEWKNLTMSHDEIVENLQKARYALMPTRTDAQGVMMCEMAAFGIPVITSDIPICHEVFDGFANVDFISNDDEKFSLDNYKARNSICMKDTRYYSKNTVKKEIEVIQKLLSGNG